MLNCLGSYATTGIAAVCVYNNDPSTMAGLALRDTHYVYYTYDYILYGIVQNT